MISLSDFKEKQILFVNTEWDKPSHLRFYNDNIIFEKEKKVVNRVSVHKAFAIFVCGDLSLTTNFLKQAKEHGVSIMFMKTNFETYGGLAVTAEGHYVLRVKQYNQSNKKEFEMSRKLVQNKILNQVTLLKVKSDTEEKKKWEEELLAQYNKLINTKNQDEVRGIEGSFSRKYFGKYFKLVGWRRRAPRTKEDMINFLMDMGYTFLFNFVDSLLRLHGFDTYKGFYHKLFFQRRSLACDLMEPFRCIIDKQILKAINLKQVNESDFEINKGMFKLPFDKNPKYAGLFLEVLMENKEDIFNYIHGFYCHIMNESKYDFPNYQFK